MNKIILSLTALITSLAAFVGLLSVSLNNTPLLGGAFESQITRTASGTAISATGTYFHEAAGTRTATTTLLTLEGLKSAEKIGLSVIVKNATNSPGKIFVLPEVSTDASEWKVLAGLYLVNGAAGAFVSDIDLGNGSTTQFTYTPNSQGTTSVLTWFNTPVIGSGSASTAYMRFRVWTTGTSSIMLEGYKLLK